MRPERITTGSPLAESIPAKSEPKVRISDLLSGWWIVTRPVAKTRYRKAKTIIVAAFPNKKMADGWISEASHRRNDKSQPLNNQAQPLRD